MIKIKQLIWHTNSPDSHWANIIWGSYMIKNNEPSWIASYVGNDDVDNESLISIGESLTLEEAKELCQKSFENDIRTYIDELFEV